MQQEDQQQEPVVAQQAIEDEAARKAQSDATVDPLPEVDFLEGAAAEPADEARDASSEGQASKRSALAGLPFSLKKMVIGSVIAIAIAGGASAWLALRDQGLAAPPVVPQPELASSFEPLPADLGVVGAGELDQTLALESPPASYEDDDEALTHDIGVIDHVAAGDARSAGSSIPASAQQLQALEQQVMALQSALAQQQSWNATLEAGLVKAGLLRQEDGQATLDVQHFIASSSSASAAAPAAKRAIVSRPAAPRQQPRREAVARAPEPAEPQVKLVSIDMWNGQPSVVVGTTDTSLGYRVLQVGDSTRGITLQSADPVTQTAVFLVGGKPQILRKVQ
ncbi:hypothetical protein D8I35_03160 [Corticibacter populi]|uniref:Uncharacterized protein n=2 Tax=Corticibacter populi TaxID=1550736 RepID=A0A3M6QYN2_9BURK|nr:hypothetical protein D8I35_03160 [Corticibacter populi]RZS35390.1 hypothetical protein EV687_0455 [Corticibacter populi]